MHDSDTDIQLENNTDVEDERTSMQKEIEKAISGLKSKVFNEEFDCENNRGFISLTIRRKYGIDPKSKPIVELYVEQDAREVERRLKTIPGYDVKVVSATITKERYSDPGAGLNFERIALFGRKKPATDSVSDETDVEDKLIDPPENIIRDFENELKRNNIKVVGKGKTLMGRNHYQVEFGGKDYELHKIFTQISSKLGRVEIPMTWSIGVDNRGVTTAGVDLDKQYVKDEDNNVEDAMEKYYIRWIDQYSKSKGYDKSFWLHDDEVKANSAKEALDKLANIAVMRGVGTRYVTIVNIKTDKTSYQVSGNIDDLRKRQLDSMASTYEKATKGLKEQLNNVGDSCKVGKYKVTKIK